MCVNCKTNFYRNGASSYIDLKAYLICKEITVKETGKVWYNSEKRETKKVMRKAENLYHEYGNDYYKTKIRKAKQAKCNFVTAAKCTYCISQISDPQNDSSKLYCLLNGLLGKSNDENPLPIRSSVF